MYKNCVPAGLLVIFTKVIREAYLAIWLYFYYSSTCQIRASLNKPLESRPQ